MLFLFALLVTIMFISQIHNTTTCLDNDLNNNINNNNNNLKSNPDQTEKNINSIIDKPSVLTKEKVVEAHRVKILLNTIDSSNHNPYTSNALLQTYLTYLHYHQQYTHVIPKSPSKYQYKDIITSTTIPDRAFTNTAVPPLKDLERELAKFFTDNQLTPDNLYWMDTYTINQLDNLEKRRLESEVVDEFYSYETKMDQLQTIQKEYEMKEALPEFDLPLEPIHPRPMISAPYLFLHVPKTGGNTIVNLFKFTYGTTKVRHQWVHPGYREKNILAGQKAIVGHFNYGLHTYLEGEERDNFSYMTLLRDPVERVLSHYFYHRENLEDPEHDLAERLPLADWILQSPRGSNEQTRVLSGIAATTESRVSDESFRMAMYHLRKMKFVGITERFMETTVLMKYYCGLSTMRDIKLNQRRSKVDASSIPKETIELIRKHNWMDIHLYEEALKMFERQLDIVGRERVNQEVMTESLWK
ncbi:hypothetical protein SAMD00019534_069980 [Acytostelium subglobosum LB1]|uniref:hypothetical protein n=1 Tax=Acytostelium subglobosum LB1 TaxID=1410327 RepID=UPI00064483B9|nr:hypothetical protein SAMD00019534_069980 [Acytostelium subglobosum LB1]GAM23823.1 hypothetical protein SAMD00019534_069980 [Acytostelium subglobosum LB1]|eukprot:XP_012753564.1 hypothetical protein SAMD00019534_069980 [Acytostelium subglobosum LB1]